MFKKLIAAAALMVVVATAFGQSADGIQISNTGKTSSVPFLFNSTGFDRWYDAAGRADANTGLGLGAIGNYVYNGASWDRLRGGAATGSLLVSASATDPCQSSGVAKSQAIISVTTATTTSLVPVSSTTVVYVCAFAMSISQVVTTANTIKFVRGTGAACVTGPTDLTGAFGAGGVTAAAPIVVSASPGSTLFKTNAGDALCVTTTIGASASFMGFVTYVQQ